MQQCSIFIYILAVSVCPCLPAAVVALDLLLGWGVKVLGSKVNAVSTYRSRHVETAKALMTGKVNSFLITVNYFAVFYI